MSKLRTGEKIGKALRRQAQIAAMKREEVQTGAALSSSCTPAPLTTSGVSHHTSADTPSRAGGSALSHDEASRAVPSHTMRAALLGERDAYQSTEQRQLLDVLRTSQNKEAAANAFLTLARASGEVASAATYSALASALVRHQASNLMGAQAFAEALSDATSADDERWGSTSGGLGDAEAEAEARAFALYQCCRLERHAERGSSFNKQLGLTLEGSDNGTVALVEYQLRRSCTQQTSLPVSSEVLADLMHMDVSWTAALNLHHYAREIHKGAIDPPVEMSDRVTGLMTGYRTNGVGSRPWRMALELYARVLQSGYTPTLRTHSHALDAVWRRGDQFQTAHQHRSKEEKNAILQQALTIKARVEGSPHLCVTGDEGSAYVEALVKAVCAGGSWESAIALISDTDTTVEGMSHRLLLPTAETFAFAMAACNAAGNAAHAEALRALMGSLGYKSLRKSLHSEALLVYLQSLRAVVATNPQVGQIVEELTSVGGGGAAPAPLDRPCAVACLQLLVSRQVRTESPKWELAERLFRTYDSNTWLQEPLPRKIELQTVFRCCYLISTECREGQDRVGAERLMATVRNRTCAIFGLNSAEMQWLADTEVYILQRTSDWRTALEIYKRQVEERPGEYVKYLPVPLRQVRLTLMQSLLRGCRVACEVQDDSEFLLEDDLREEEKAAVADLASNALEVAKSVYSDADKACDTPHEIVAELQLLVSVHAHATSAKPTSPSPKALAVQAMRELALGSADAVTPRLVDLISQALSITAAHVEGATIEGHARLRGTVLGMDVADKRHVSRSGVEQVFL